MTARIMIIDDNPDVTLVISLLLQSRGYETATALSGEEGLAKLAEGRTDLILCDIMMPGLDGFQVFKRVRADRRWQLIPFVFVTALSDVEVRSFGTEMGVEAYITKPFNKQDLLSVIAGLLRRARELQTYTEHELDSFKAQLLYMITHELNTPLSVMRMMTDTLRRNLARYTRAQMEEYVELLANSTDELSSIVESMLLALQIDSGRAQELYEKWSAPQLLRTALGAVIAGAEAHAAECRVSVGTEGFEQPLWVKAHEQQLSQIFSRILDNAIRFSPKGGRVKVILRREGERARVTFADQGPGLTAEEISAAFGRLQQINREQQEQQGVGLSLSLVRALVQIHGGEITVDSEPGAGSSFHVLLPLIAAPA